MATQAEIDAKEVKGFEAALARCEAAYAKLQSVLVPIKTELYDGNHNAELDANIHRHPTIDGYLQLLNDVNDAVIDAGDLYRDLPKSNTLLPYLAPDFKSFVKAQQDAQEALKWCNANRNLHIKGEEQRKARRYKAGQLAGRGWVGRWPLGEGGYGKVNLWVRQDQSGAIVDRLVMKDANIGIRRKSPREWVDIIINNGKQHWLPLEVATQMSFQNRTGSENVAGIRGWFVTKPEPFDYRGKECIEFRQWLEFYPNGDLHDLVTKAYGQQDLMIPEEFIWCVADCLATAGVLMERGNADTEGPSAKNWDQVIHGDMKLQNIMLGERSDEKYRQYPRAVLVDFGMAVWMDPGKEKFSRGGTRGHKAPEAAGVLVDGKGQKRGLHPNTDVWSVGEILYCLMDGQSGRKENDFSDLAPGDEKDFPPWQPRVRAYYSSALVQMVEKCMHWRPEHRYTFTALKKYVENFTSAGFLRDASLLDPRWTGHMLVGQTNHQMWPLYGQLKNARPPSGGFLPPPIGSSLSPERTMGYGDGEDPGPEGEAAPSDDPMVISDDDEDEAAPKRKRGSESARSDPDAMDVDEIERPAVRKMATPKKGAGRVKVGSPVKAASPMKTTTPRKKPKKAEDDDEEWMPPKKAKR